MPNTAGYLCIIILICVGLCLGLVCRRGCWIFEWYLRVRWIIFLTSSPLNLLNFTLIRIYIQSSQKILRSKDSYKIKRHWCIRGIRNFTNITNWKIHGGLKVLSIIAWYLTRISNNNIQPHTTRVPAIRKSLGNHLNTDSSWKYQNKSYRTL